MPIPPRRRAALPQRLLAGPIAGVAVRLGLIAAEHEVMGRDTDEFSFAADIALYEPGPDGVMPVQRYAQEIEDTLPEVEKRVLKGMGKTAFSIFRVAGTHRGAGVDMTDLVSGKRMWVVDRGLEAKGEIRRAARP